VLEFHINNIYARVNKKKATYEEAKILHKMLSVKTPGHYFSQKFKRGQWDGYKRFFNLLTYSFFSGLLPFVISKIDGVIEYSIIDERSFPEVQNNSPDLNGIELRDYQLKMVEEAIEAKRGIIASPTNSGKTEISAAVIKILGLPAIFATHRLTLLRQTRERFEKRLGIKVGIIGGGEEEIRDVNVVSVATIAKRLDDPIIVDLLKKSPLIFVDECHHASARTIEKCLKASDAVYRFGLSATALLRDEISNMIVKGLLGEEIVTVTSSELIKAGISAFPSVYLLKVTEPKVPQHYTFDLAYEHGILNNEYRNELIVSSAERFLKLGKSVFILVWRIAHGDILLKMFEDKKIDSEFISGREKPDYIKDVLKRFSSKELKCVISSTISDEGLDIPAIDVEIMGVGFKAPLKTIQRTGRALREKTGSENIVTIIDFMDFHSKRYLLKHSIDRCREYVKMGIPIFEVVDNNWDKIEEA